MVERIEYRSRPPVETSAPKKLEMMLPIGISSPPEDRKNWLLQASFPGLRATTFIDQDGNVKIITQSRDNVTENFEEIAKDLFRLNRRRAKKATVMTGTLFCPNGHQGPKAAERRSKQTPLQQKKAPIKPCLFLAEDIVFHNGQSLTDKSIEQRNAVLIDLLGNTTSALIPLTLKENTQKNAANISKVFGIREVYYRKKGSKYKPGTRSREWLRGPVRRKRIRHDNRVLPQESQ